MYRTNPGGNWARIVRPDLETVIGAMSSSSLSDRCNVYVFFLTIRKKSSSESVSYSSHGKGVARGGPGVPVTPPL